MTRPDWATHVSEWVAPDDWRRDCSPYRGGARWSAQSRDRSGAWVVDVWGISEPISFGVRFASQQFCVERKLTPVPVIGSPDSIADLFRRIDAAIGALRGHR